MLYTGKVAIGKGRYGLKDKLSIAGLVESSEEWQEKVFLQAYRHYDLKSVKHLVLGGDGGGWIRRSFDSFEMPVIYELCRFHLFRAARQAAAREPEKLVQLVRRACEEGFPAVELALQELLAQHSGKAQDKLIAFYNYLYHNADGLIDYRTRLGLSKKHYRGLGAIEGNVDKLVAQRMKRRGMSWRIPGAKAMIKLCQYRSVLAQLALQPSSKLALDTSRPCRRRRRPLQDHGAWLYGSVPARNGPAEGRPWVQKLRRMLNGEPDLPVAYALPSNS